MGWMLRGGAQASVGGAASSATVRRIGQAGEEVAAPLGGHVEQAPQRIDEVAGAVMLAGVGRAVAHLARPMVADGVAVLLKDVEDRLVPILALGHAALGALRCGQLRSVAIIVGRIAARSEVHTSELP